MEQFIGCDAHKKFSVFVAVNEKGQTGEAMRVAHDRQLYREFLTRLPARSAIAVEASGSYGWLVDEMERSGHRPRLCNPLEAKRRMGLTNKTDKLDATGLAILLRNGTLPEVWIPPSELRDQRELLRLRIFLVRLRTRVKNRIHGTLARHNVQVPGADRFGVGPRLELSRRLPELPAHSKLPGCSGSKISDDVDDQIRRVSGDHGNCPACSSGHDGRIGDHLAVGRVQRGRSPWHPPARRHPRTPHGHLYPAGLSERQIESIEFEGHNGSSIRPC
jgi:transposase